MAGEMAPTKFWFWRSKPVTLWCFRPQVTPTHLQKWRELFQEENTPLGSSIICDLNSSNAAVSESLPSAAAEALLGNEKERKSGSKMMA